MEANKQMGSFRKHKVSDDSAEKRTRFVDTESIGGLFGKYGSSLLVIV